MQASEVLAKRQREWPLAGQDRGAAFFSKLAPIGNPTLEAKRVTHALIAGEVGRPLPNAKTFHYPDGSHAIMIFSGLIDFYDSAAKILFGATNLFGRHERVKAAYTIDGAIANLQALFERWTPQGIAANRTAEVTQSPLAPSQAAFAEMLAESALLFVLSHELGHVFYYRLASDAEEASPPKLTQAQELESDVAGMQSLIGSAHGSEARMRLAGIAVSMRVLAVFGELGHTFPADHPEPVSRLAALMTATRRFCKTEREFWSLSPIAYSFDEQLETAGMRASSGQQRPAARADRIFSRLSAVLENAATGAETPSKVVEVMAYDFQNAPPEVLAEVAQTAARMFQLDPAVTESPDQDALWAEKGRIFRSVSGQWPERAKSAFQNLRSGD